MKIACLGWGSLIWDPRNLDIDGEWRDDGPKLPVEFARKSRDGRLTLVLRSDVEPIEVLWSMMGTNDLNYARKDLQKREGAYYLSDIHYVTKKDSKGDIPVVLESVRAWLDEKGLDAVIWTGLGSNFEEMTGRIFDKENTVKYLSSLKGETRQKAKEYIQRTPLQIRTAVREKVEKELGWEPIGK